MVNLCWTKPWTIYPICSVPVYNLVIRADSRGRGFDMSTLNPSAQRGGERLARKT